MELEEFIELFDNEVSRDLALKLFCEQFNCFVILPLLYREQFERYGICFSIRFRTNESILSQIIVKSRKDLIDICKFFNCEDNLYMGNTLEDFGFSINDVSKTIEEVFITGIGRNLNYIVDKPIDCHDIKFGDLFFTEFNCVVKLFSHGSEKLLYSYRNYYSMKKEDE